jgi:CelD/BcsL family acetyltransferase involved in cellulose biosynthesis
MELTLHQTFPQEMKEEWNALLDGSITNVPFLRYEYLENWWRTLGGGEWRDAELALVTARQNGRLSGIAPFFTAEVGGKPTLHLVGAIEVSDYLDLIVSAQDLPAFADGLLDFLSGPDFVQWQTMEWYNLPESSPTLALLDKGARERGWNYHLEIYKPSPYITLPGDWETYLAGIDKKQRHEIRRKIRRLEGSGFEVRYYTVKEGDTLEAEMDDFLLLMEQERQKSDFLSDAMRQHMRNTARVALESGMLHLSFLEIGGKKAAAKFCFDYLKRLWGYNSGVEREFYEFSPGWVLLSYELQWANENGRAEFDFMRGDEEYKYRFGAVDRHVMRATLSR